MGERFSERMRKQRADVILRETTSLLAEQGCCELRVEDVARRAGVAKGTIYLDFQSKEHLVATALERASEQLVEDLRTRAGRGAGAEGLRAAAGYLAGLHLDRPALAALLDRRVLCGASADELDTAPAARLEKEVAALIRAAAGSLDGQVEPDLAAYAAVALAQAPLWRRVDDSRDRAERAIALAIGLGPVESARRAQGGAR